MNQNFGGVGFRFLTLSFSGSSDDADELSFVLGELILVSQDLGDGYLGHLCDGSDLLSDKKVRSDKIAPTTKKGNVYKRASSDVVTIRRVGTQEKK